MPPNKAAEAIDAVWRIESARLIAGLARLVGDVGIAEDLAQDALVIALEQWPKTGVPDIRALYTARRMDAAERERCTWSRPGRACKQR